MDIEIDVRTAEGWETRTLTGVESVSVVGAPGEGGVQLTLIGEREGDENTVIPGILDVAPRHENLLANSVPRTAGGTSIPVAIRNRN